MDKDLELIKKLAQKKDKISPEDVRILISKVSNFTRNYLEKAGFDPRAVRAILTKFRDAGRRSAPWKPTSSRVPGRPQDGSDGNRRLRWLFEEGHKFYADEVSATLVEVKYYMQLLSMLNAPPLPENSIQDDFIWLTGHKIEPGLYLDPIQLKQMDINEVMLDLRSIQSGHLVPLDRGGKHEPKNVFLLYYRSNQLQGNLTVDELLDLMQNILERHNKIKEVRDTSIELKNAEVKS